jgi:hypothetical protein
MRAETLLTESFLYLDQPLILGCTITIVILYYKLGRKKFD